MRATYGTVATKLRNAMECIEGYELMAREGQEIPVADLVLAIGEVTLALDGLSDLLYAEVRARETSASELPGGAR